MTAITVATAPATSLSPRVLARRIVRSLVTIGLLVAVWMTIAPTAIGGPATYVVTDGTSMLPRLHADGLVVTQAADDYRVGDVVAYHNRDLGAVVLHRIVAIDGDRYVFKGDNNDFLDSYHPTRSELVGREWLYLPHAGAYLRTLRSPRTFGVIAALAGLAAGSAFMPARKRRRRRRHVV